MTNSLDSTSPSANVSPALTEVMDRARELDKITPHLVRAPDGKGWVGSSDARWLKLYKDARDALRNEANSDRGV